MRESNCELRTYKGQKAIQTRSYHSPNIIIEVEAEDDDWHEQEEQPHEADAGEDQEQLENDHGSGHNEHHGGEGSQVS